MPSIGSLSFTTMRGLPQSAFSPSQIADCRAACLAAGLIPAMVPSDGATGITTEITKTTESECAQLAESCRALVGTIVTAEVDTGASVSRQYVHSVNCQWRAVRKTSVIFLFTASWTLVPSYPETDVDSPRLLSEVYTATVFGQWTRRPELRCFGASEGLCSYAGEADLVQKIGYVNGSPADPLAVIGQWVEIRARVAVGRTAKPVWWGRIQSRTLTRIDAGSECSFHAVGLADCLRQIYPTRWYEDRSGALADPGEMIEFGGTIQGNRTKEDGISIDGVDCFIHDRAHSIDEGGDHSWKASNVINTALTGIGDQFPGGPKWILSGQTDALEYEYFGDMSGSSIFDVLQALANPSRGITWTAKPLLDGPEMSVRSVSLIRIEISTLSPAEKTISGSATPQTTTPIAFAAAARQADVDLTPSNVVDWRIEDDASEVADVIYLQFPRDQHATTVGYNDDTQDDDSSDSDANGPSQLSQAWTSAEFTDWDAASTVKKEQPAINHVWRTFKLKRHWKGQPYHQTFYLPTGVGRDVRDDGSETGFFRRGTDDDIWIDGSSTKLLRNLPIPTGVDWTDTGSILSLIAQGAIDFKKPPVRTMCWKVKDNVWTSLHFSYEITVSTDEKSLITVGRNAADAIAIKAIVDAGYDLVFTIGYELPKPRRASWRRTSVGVNVGLPANQERVMFIRMHGDNYASKYVDARTVLGLDGTSDIPTPQTFEVYRPDINQLLELAKMRYAEPRKSLTWTVDGELDLSVEKSPGLLINRANVPYARRTPRLENIGSAIVRRSWSFGVDSLKTVYTANSLLAEANVPVHAPKAPGGGLRGGARNIGTF